jgi:hypothetical protein
MRTIFLPLFLLFLFSLNTSAQQKGIFFGENAKNDENHGMLYTTDGAFLFFGVVNNDAALYKFDCSGQITDSLRKDLTLSNSFEGFRDAIELSNGDYLAVGYAKAINPNKDLVMLMRVNAQLQEQAFDTLKVNGKTANAFKVCKSGNRYFIAGYIESPDFGDVFVSEINPLTLALIGNPSVFSYGTDDLHAMTTTSDGALLLSGMATAGNIFAANSLLDQKAFIRKVKPDGTLIWEHVRSEKMVNKFGRVTYDAVLENPNTGHLIVAGTHFSGDTLQNALDVRITLFNADGTPLDTADLMMPGQQNIHATLPFAIPGIYLSGGDSTGLVAGDFRGGYTTVFGENNGEIVVLDANSSPAPFSVKGLVNVPEQRIGFAGVFYDPSEVNPSTNRDVFVAVPIIEVDIDFDGCELTSNITSDGSTAPQYQWLLDGAPIADAIGNTHIPTASGEYALMVTDAAACGGVSMSQVLTIQVPQAMFTYVQSNLSFDFQNTSTNVAFSNWNFGDGNTSAATNPTHTYASAGTYTVTLMVSDLCDALKDTTVTVLGVVDTKQPDGFHRLEVSPNPASDVLHVRLQTTQETDVLLQLFDTKGQLQRTAVERSVQATLRHDVDVQQLPTGIYLLCVSTTSGTRYVKMVKE